MLQSPKIAILRSLDEMDQKQMDEVLGYIKEVMHRPTTITDHQTFKRQALKEIRKALRKERKQVASFAA